MIIRCVCGQKYNVKDELAGQHVRCRKCGENVLVQSADHPMPVQPVQVQQPAQPAGYGLPPSDPNSLGEISDQQMSVGPAYGAPGTAFPARPQPGPRPKSKRIRIDFSHVNKGLQFIVAGIITAALCALLAVLFLTVGILPVVGFLLFGAFVGNILSMVGYAFCIGVPVQTGARPLIIAANVCNVLNVLISLLSALAKLGGQVKPSPFLDLSSFLLSTATMILFLLFLKKVAEFVEDRAAAHDAWSLLVFYLAVGGIWVGFLVSIFFVVPFLPPTAGVIYVVVGILSLLIVFLIWFIHFVKYINDLEFRRARRY